MFITYKLNFHKFLYTQLQYNQSATKSIFLILFSFNKPLQSENLSYIKAETLPLLYIYLNYFLG